RGRQQISGNSHPRRPHAGRCPAPGHDGGDFAARENRGLWGRLQLGADPGRARALGRSLRSFSGRYPFRPLMRLPARRADPGLGGKSARTAESPGGRAPYQHAPRQRRRLVLDLRLHRPLRRYQRALSHVKFNLGAGGSRERARPAAVTRRIRLSSGRWPASALQEIAQDLRACAVAIFPTETVYGIGASVFSREGVRRIYELKGRQWRKPLALLVHELQAARPLVEEIPPEADRLARRFWPGPLTLIFRASALGRLVMGGAATLGVRIPDHPAALGILK